jgi:hypothetical protein
MLEKAGLLANFLRKVSHRAPLKKTNQSRRRLVLEWLEIREMLTGGATGGVGVDYSLMGGKWNNAQTITFSFPSDGTSWGTGTNNLNATLDAEFGGTSWKTLIEDAFQVWASATNLNFTLVSDDNAAFNASGQAEGDSRFGDIRIGGYNLGTSSVIAQTYGPPTGGGTEAGDVELNTSMNFAPGSGYDFESVMIHEIGHALGLGESPQASSVMYTYYSGIHTTLSSYDVEGIQSLYGAPIPDSYQAAGQATSASTALNLTTYLNPSNQTQLAGVSLDSIGDTEYFSVVTPQINGSTLKVAAQPSGYSQLSPKVTVIDPTTGATLATAFNPSEDGELALTSIPGVVPGHRYLIEVTGATNNNFAVGSYAVQVGFFGGTAIKPAPAPSNPSPVSTSTPTSTTTTTTTSTPVQSTPVVTTPAAPVIQADAYAYNESFADATPLGSLGLTTAANLTLPSALNYQLFSFTVQSAGTVEVAAGNVNVVVGNSSAIPVVQGTGLLIFNAPTAGAKYYLLFLSGNAQPVANYGFAVRVIPAPTPTVTAAAAITTTTKSSKTTTSIVAAKLAAVKTKVTTRPKQ